MHSGFSIPQCPTHSPHPKFKTLDIRGELLPSAPSAPQSNRFSCSRLQSLLNLTLCGFLWRICDFCSKITSSLSDLEIVSFQRHSWRQAHFVSCFIQGLIRDFRWGRIMKMKIEEDAESDGDRICKNANKHRIGFNITGLISFRINHLFWF